MTNEGHRTAFRTVMIAERGRLRMDPPWVFERRRMVAHRRTLPPAGGTSAVENGVLSFRRPVSTSGRRRGWVAAAGLDGRRRRAGRPGRGTRRPGGGGGRRPGSGRPARTIRPAGLFAANLGRPSAHRPNHPSWGAKRCDRTSSRPEVNWCATPPGWWAGAASAVTRVVTEQSPAGVGPGGAGGRRTGRLPFGSPPAAAARSPGRTVPTVIPFTPEATWHFSLFASTCEILRSGERP